MVHARWANTAQLDLPVVSYVQLELFSTPRTVNQLVTAFHVVQANFVMDVDFLMYLGNAQQDTTAQEAKTLQRLLIIFVNKVRDKTIKLSVRQYKINLILLTNS